MTVTALGESVGELHVGLRTPGEKWTAEQEAAVDEVADRAGTLAYAAGLVTDIARSRGRIVVAREEERRRLRADLHDGVAPALAGTALQLESLARTLDQAASRSWPTVRSACATGSAARSPSSGRSCTACDRRSSTSSGWRRAATAGRRPRDPALLRRDRDLGEPHAAIEVAAYAIAAEAFGNALRHSAASRVALPPRECRGRDRGVRHGQRHRDARASAGRDRHGEHGASARPRSVAGSSSTPTPGGGTTSSSGCRWGSGTSVGSPAVGP